MNNWKKISYLPSHSRFSDNCIFRENISTHTRFFIYQWILLKFWGYVRNTSIRMWYNFQHNRALSFGVIKDFNFTRKFEFRREYSMKVANSNLPRSHLNFQLLVKIWLKSVQPFLRYRLTFPVSVFVCLFFFVCHALYLRVGNWNETSAN